MRIWPRSLGNRVLLGMALAVGCLLAVSLAALRSLSLEPGSDQIADLLTAHVVALRALSEREAASIGGVPTSSAALEVIHASEPPEHAVSPWLPFARRLATTMESRLGDGTRVLTEEGDEPRLWVSPARPGAAWLGFRIPAFRTQALHLSLVVLCAAGLIVLLIAWWLHRELVRPLRTLSEHAPALAAGELDAPPLNAGVALEVGELSDALHRAGHEARSAARERELLLLGLSHDLRTPLARLSYAMELLRGEDEALITDMRADVEELDQLIGVLLQRARGTSSESLAEVDLSSMLRQAIGIAQRKDWHLEGPGECLVRARPLTLRRVLDNLVGNAVRHAHPPYGCRWGADDRVVWCEVADAGPGLPQIVRARLQRPIDESGLADVGLGLTVARHLLGGMAGVLDVRDGPGGGTCMRISWPIDRSV